MTWWAEGGDGRAMSEIRIGTSGWSYDHWNTVLYEPSLAPTDRLRRYTQESTRSS
jgi:uncharacterized protein YecE (DUF72 family)